MPAETPLDGAGAAVTLPGALNWEPRGSRHLGSGGGAPATLFQDAWVQVPAPLFPSCVTMGRLLSLSVSSTFKPQPPPVSPTLSGCIAACGIFHCVQGLFSSCGVQALEPMGSGVAVWGLGCPVACGILVPQPGIQPVSPALEGISLPTGPPGKPCFNFKVGTMMASVSRGLCKY